jgi:hypothetical protein
MLKKPLSNVKWFLYLLDEVLLTMEDILLT